MIGSINYFDWIVAERHSVDCAFDRVQVGLGIDLAQLELDAHASGVDLDAR